MVHDKVKIRPARQTDRALVKQAFEYAGVEIDPAMEHALGGRQLGNAVPSLGKGIEGLARTLATAVSGPDSFDRAVILTSAVLVAEDDTGRFLGAAAVRPTVSSLEALMDHYPASATELGIKGLAGTSKLIVLAVVPDCRSQGIGRHLLSAIVDLYRQGGAPMIYGVIEGHKASTLIPFYERAGFHVLDPGGLLDFSHVYGVKHFVRCDPGERFFYLDLRDPSSRRWTGPTPTYVKDTPRTKPSHDHPGDTETTGLWSRFKRALRPSK